MKKVLLSLTMLSILCLTFSSCKKNIEEEEEEPVECEHTTANLAGVYKLTSSFRIESGGDVDVLHQMYDACELDDLNELKADGTFIYTDAGTSCGGAASFTGYWLVNENFLNLNGGASNIESFDCRKLVVTFRDEESNLIKETYTKQN